MRGVSGHGRRGLGVLLLGAQAFGCGGDGEQPRVREGEQVAAFCEANCRRAAECFGGDEASCRSYCEANSTSVRNLRAEAVEIAAECIVQISCSTFFDDDSFVPCWDRAEEELEPNASVRRFCKEWSRRWFECGSWYSVEQCESDWVINGASYLDDMLGCTTVACAAFSSCVETVAGMP